jgi:hypothetical protein
MPILADREDAGWLKLTSQKYYRVSGSSVQIKGVVPDLILPGLSDAYETGEGFKKYALPHDIIRRSPDFAPLERMDCSFLNLRIRVVNEWMPNRIIRISLLTSRELRGTQRKYRFT